MRKIRRTAGSARTPVIAVRASPSVLPIGVTAGRMSRDPSISRTTTASESSDPSQKTSESGRWSPSIINPPSTGPRAKPSGPVAPNSPVTVPTRSRGVTSRSAASITPVFPSWSPTSRRLAASCHGSWAIATPANTTASTTALRTITARRLYLSAQTPQNGTRTMPNTKIRLLNRPVKVGTWDAGSPTSPRRSGRNENTWATPMASTVEVIP